MFKDYCIICGISKETEKSMSFFPLFVDSDETNEIYFTKYGSMISEYIFDEVHPNSNYPQFICEVCNIKLYEYKEFKEMAITTQSHITEMLRETEISSDETITDAFKEGLEIDSMELIDINNLKKEISPPSCLNMVNIETEQKCIVSMDSNSVDNFEKNQKFRCKICLIVFDNGIILEEHMNEHPTCPICNRTFVKKKNLDMHLTKHFIDTKEEQEQDISESMTSRTPSNVLTEDWIDNKSDIVNGPIEYCSYEVVEYIDSLDEYSLLNGTQTSPEINSNDNERFSCRLCDRTYLHKRSLLAHLRDHNNQSNIDVNMNMDMDTSTTVGKSDVFQCEICNREFLHKRNLINHLQTHLVIKSEPKETFACSMCDNEYAHQRSLDYHIKRNHGFQNHNLINSLGNDNPNVNRFPCTLCNRTFVSRRNMSIHLMTHDSPPKKRRAQPKRYVCVTCGKKFATPSTLREHEFRHKDERPIECEICHKHFKMMKDLLIHRRIHTGERKFVCDECGKSFYMIRQLRNHKESHSDVPLYECNICLRKLKTRNTLDSHMTEVHKKAGQYQCGICNAPFGLKHRLTKHMKSHIKKGIIKREQVEDYIKFNPIL